MHADVMSLIVVVPKQLKDAIVDALIGLECISGFNMDTIAGFSRKHSHLNVHEQVQGYRHLIRFEVICDHAHLEELLAVLQPVCEPARARYWITPVIAQGHFTE